MSYESATKLGLLADSHDNMDRLRDAVGFFNREGVDLVLHAGDFISPLTAGPLSALEAELIGVFGNNDGDKLFLRRRFREEEVGKIERSPCQLRIGGKSVILMHEPFVLEALRNSTVPDLIIYGHTHESELLEGPPLVVNPGEVGGWLTGESTVALVSLEEMEASIRPLPAS